MDIDPRDERVGPMKLARTDAFPLKMQSSRGISMASDCRQLACSPTNSTATDTTALFGSSHELQNAIAIARYNSSNNNNTTSSCNGLSPYTAARAAQYLQESAYQQELAQLKSSGLGLTMDAASPVVFTANQLRELQLHALIFKYMMCGVNVPPELALPIRTSVLGMSAAAANHQFFGWGNYHHLAGYGGSVDPEPGRCRRTDGKKWRCSRDVVPDQKYCERHMHRGRHRRKPPEPPNGTTSLLLNSSPGPAGASSTSAKPNDGPPRQLQPASSASAAGSMSIGSSGGSFHQGSKDFRSTYMQQAAELSQDQTLFSDARGHDQSPALSSLTSKHSFLGNSTASMDSISRSDHSEGQPLRRFFDDWPRGSATQLSISVPQKSNPSTPRALSPLKLSMARDEAEDPQMGLSVGLGVADTSAAEAESRTATWVAVTWESGTVGGPLAEVLQSSNNTPRGGSTCTSSAQQQSSSTDGHHCVVGKRPGLNLLSADKWETGHSSPRSSS